MLEPKRDGEGKEKRREEVGVKKRELEEKVNIKTFFSFFCYVFFLLSPHLGRTACCLSGIRRQSQESGERTSRQTDRQKDRQTDWAKKVELDTLRLLRLLRLKK